MELKYYTNFNCLDKIEIISFEEKDIKDGQITINIPAIINKYKINVIGNNVVSHSSGAHKTEIKGFLFAMPEIASKITSVKYIIEEGPTIINNLQSTKLIEVTIPSSVVNINYKSFYKTKLSISFKEDSQLREIGDKAFANAKFQSELILPANLKYIGKSAFMDSDLSKGFTFNEQLETIDAFAFQRALFEIEKILKFPNSLKTIKEHAFDECTVVSQIIFEKGTNISKICNHAFSFCSAEFLQINEGKNILNIEDNCFCNMYDLEKVNIESANIQKLSNNCFLSCEELISINLPKKLKVIGENAFYDCKRLKCIIIPEFVSEIENQAFFNCALEVISLKCKKLEYIGDSAFASNNLKEIPAKIFESLSRCGNRVFESNLIEKITLNAPKDELCLGAYLFSNNYKLKTVEMKNTSSRWTKVPQYMFQNCISLMAITIPESIWHLREGCFSNTAIVDITIPSITKVSDYAFYNCSKLKNVNLLNPKFDFCGKGVFSNCKALEKVNFNLFYSNINEDVFDDKSKAEVVLADNPFILIC